MRGPLSSFPRPIPNRRCCRRRREAEALLHLGRRRCRRKELAPPCSPPDTLRKKRISELQARARARAAGEGEGMDPPVHGPAVPRLRHGPARPTGHRSPRAQAPRGAAPRHGSRLARAPPPRRPPRAAASQAPLPCAPRGGELRLSTSPRASSAWASLPRAPPPPPPPPWPGCRIFRPARGRRSCTSAHLGEARRGRGGQRGKKAGRRSCRCVESREGRAAAKLREERRHGSAGGGAAGTL
ncbi:formin-like protein 5 [Panicum virgatum]|uniref:formin-like protein 5 n=1 Tax=Panicum virgatum TaxID=38727 RepID=UPI0019D5CCF9|nr:formin-like protein 5 [Panicum virgatum]